MNQVNPNDLASPVVTESARSAELTYSNTIVGGMSKRLEIATRLAQGLMPFAITAQGKTVDPRVIVNLSFAYADIMLEHEAKAQEPEAAPAPSLLVVTQ